MVDTNRAAFEQTVASNDSINIALLRAAQDAALTHARLGRSIPEWRDGQVVWLAPAEIFARYGLDENGKPKA
jgi:hypothetical protein